MTLRMDARIETWELTKCFRIASGEITRTDLVVVTLEDDGVVGRGEGSPFFVYNQTAAGELAAIESVRQAIEHGVGREALGSLLPPGPARNAIDCALWDIEAKRTGGIWSLLDLPAPSFLDALMTIGLDEPAAMAREAERLSEFPELKIKLNADRIMERMNAIRAAAPRATLVIDANEGWTGDLLREVAPALADLGVEMIEQPVPRGHDETLAGFQSPIKLCVDESLHTCADLDRVQAYYDVINIKLDKTGGLTEALKLAELGQDRGLELMVGNMMGTSLSMAPSYVIGSLCAYRDLDGPAHYVADRDNGMPFEHGRSHLFTPALWG